MRAVELTTGAARHPPPSLPSGLDGRDSPDRMLPQPLELLMLRHYAFLLSLPLLGTLVCGCDPASAERGTIEVNSDRPTLSDQILKPPGVAVPPNVARRGSQPKSGDAVDVPSKAR